MFNNIKKLFGKVKDLLVTGKEKAVVSGFVAAVAAFLVENGLTFKDLWSVNTLWALVVFIVAHQATYWTSNKRPEAVG